MAWDDSHHVPLEDVRTRDQRVLLQSLICGADHHPSRRFGVVNAREPSPRPAGPEAGPPEATAEAVPR